jgi:membrane protein
MKHAAVKSIFANTCSQWNARNAPRLGAALAYYTLLSVAPLMVLVVAICGLVFKDSAETDVLGQTQDVIGPAAASALKSVVDNAHHAKGGVGATLAALAALLFGASGVFMELRSALNEIWQVPQKAGSGWRGVVLQRAVSFVMVLALGALVLASLLFSAAFTIVRDFATVYVPFLADAGAEAMNFAFSTVALAILFSLIFKFVPEARTEWRHVLVGGLCASVLFSIGRTLLGIYLAKAAIGSTYGAAGSLVAFVVWIYYSAQIFFFGAVFTKVYSESQAPFSTGAAMRPPNPG